MNRAQEILIEMLDEVSEICNENGLSMFLFSNTALSAYRTDKFEKARYELNVAMLWNDAVAFQNIVEKKQPAGRKVESLYSNPDFGSTVFRYVNTETTHISKKHYLHAREIGLSITIWPLMSKECENVKSRYRSKGTLGKIRYVLSEKQAIDQKKKRIAAMKDYIIRMHEGESLGPEDSAKLLEIISDLQKDASLEDTLYYRRYANLTRGTFPKGLFADTIEVEFEEKICRIPKDVESFFETQYKNWRKRLIGMDGLPRYEVVDEELPYSVYVDYLREKGMEEYIDKRMDFPTTRELRACYDIVDEAWDKVIRTAARINMWDQYMPLKPEILKLYEQERWGKLEEVLKDYDRVMQRLRNLGMTVFFDEDIFNIYCEMLEQRGEEGVREELWALVPEEHLKPVNVG